MEVALFFGSFNPIHLGHISIAKEALKLNLAENVWFVLTPISPFKKDSNLIPVENRLEMVQIAIDGYENMHLCDVEITQKLSNFTVDTLRYLSKTYPKNKFSILMGEDNLLGLPKWKEYEYIVSNYKIWVYPRKVNDSNKQINSPLLNRDNIQIFNADYMDISATMLRERLKNGQPVNYYMPLGVYNYIQEKNLIISQ